MEEEIRSLLERKGGKKPRLPADRVTIFCENESVERRAAEVRFGLGGRLEFVALEDSYRTRYSMDLVRLGAIAVAGRDHVELSDRVLARSDATE